MQQVYCILMYTVGYIGGSMIHWRGCMKSSQARSFVAHVQICNNHCGEPPPNLVLPHYGDQFLFCGLKTGIGRLLSPRIVMQALKHLRSLFWCEEQGLKSA